MNDLQQLTAQQSGKHVTANENFKSVRAAATFGIDYENTSALTFGYKGGILYVNGNVSDISDGTLSLTASSTNYVERTAAGVVSANVTGFSVGSIPLYVVVTGASGISTVTDYRSLTQRSFGRVSIAIGGSPTGYVLNYAQALAEVLEFTGTLIENETVTVPTVERSWIVFNNCTLVSPSYTLTIKTASGSGIAVDVGKKAILYCDGTNVVRATADL